MEIHKNKSLQEMTDGGNVLYLMKRYEVFGGNVLEEYKIKFLL